MEADPVSIKARYRELAKSKHPDVNHTAAATEEFRMLTEAYEALMSEPLAETTRTHYDPLMRARWNIRRKHRASEYPAWFRPPDGKRELHTGATKSLGLASRPVGLQQLARHGLLRAVWLLHR